MINVQKLKTRSVTKLTFELPADLEADEVRLLADFNGWKPQPFEHLKNGKWKLVQEVEPGGEYEFRYQVVKSGHIAYLNEEQAHKHVPNPHGSQNSVIVS